MDVPLNSEITYFAKTNFRGADQIFGIKRKDRRQHMYVLGKSGTGKSTLIENLIIQDIYNNQGVAVIDPHGDLVEKVIKTIPPHRVNDVIYFNPSDTKFHIGFNVLQVDDVEYKHVVASGLMGIFTKIWANAWSARMEYILNNSILALLDTPGTTLLGIPRLLVDKDYRQYIINNLKDPVIKTFWINEYETWRDQYRNEAIAPVQNKVGQFLSSAIIRNVVGQSKSTINLFDIMNQGKIFLVNVSKGRIGEDNSALMGAMLITKLQLAAMERVRIPESERKDFYLYVDEFQNFVTDSFASILSEARKYRLCLVVAHQYTAQLTGGKGGSTAVRDAVFGNVGTMVIFRVGAEDAKVLENEFKPEFDLEDFVTLPNYTIYVKLMVDGITSRPFSAATLPGVDVPNSDTTEQLIIETSRALYTRPRDEVEEEIHRWSSSLPGDAGVGASQSMSAGKFKAQCNNCKKNIFVPFEPDPSRPVYCKECLLKIKNGEIKPSAGFRAPRDKEDNLSYDSLALLGIEYSKPNQTPSPKPRVPENKPDRFEQTRETSTPQSPPPRVRTESPNVKPFVQNKQRATPIVRPMATQTLSETSQKPFVRRAPTPGDQKPVEPKTVPFERGVPIDVAHLKGEVLGEPLRENISITKKDSGTPVSEMQSTQERLSVAGKSKDTINQAENTTVKQKGALQSVLKQALGSITSTPKTHSLETEIPTVVTQEAGESISLSALKPQIEQVVSGVVKEAKLDKLALLRETIAKAQPSVSESEIIAEPARVTQQTASSDVLTTEESSTTANTETPSSSKVAFTEVTQPQLPKEVPEAVLREILKDD